MRKVNQDIINVVVSGKFTDINNRKVNYRVQVSLPNCIDEWLLSNIINRYLLETIKNCKEYREDGKIVDNESYALISSIKSAKIEWTDKKGKSLLVDTGKIPSFYGKSIFDCSYMELQDMATALGLHEVRVDDTLEGLQKAIVIAYLTRIKKISEKKLKEMSFYKYDKKRMKYYIEFSETDKKQAVIHEYQCADFEEFDEEETVLNGFRNMEDLFGKTKNIPNKTTDFKEKTEVKTDNDLIKDNNKITTI